MSARESHPTPRALPHWRRQPSLAIAAVAAAFAAACAAPSPDGEAVAASAAAAHTAPDTATSAHGALRRVPTHFAHDPEAPLTAGFLIVDGVYNSELMAPYDVLHHTPFHTEPAPGVAVFTVSPDGGPVTTFEGLVIDAHHGFDDHPPIDILVVPSAEGSMTTDLENSAMIEWVRRTGAQARFVVSLCDGAFVLAAAGLLDGRAVTTFPGDQDRFAERFPQLDLRRGVSFVHDGPAITSEGGAKSYDPAMYLVDHLYGEAVARGVGGGLLIDWPPREPDRLPLVIAVTAGEGAATATD
ncbi:MAG: glutamine amidotransferase [Acidobacteria bacterium]|nr:MAG: glutamine amidotransferase [Acidobacteriota bacterium]REK09724.1 MAG: glutamine amidotransferase [Acidobacteriota bacterium]